MNHADGKKTGREIELLRMSLGLSQTEFALIMCTSAMSVSRWERGKNPAPASAYLEMAKMAPTKTDAWRFLGYAGLTRKDMGEALGPQNNR